MTIDQFNAFCAALPATNFVEQWGGAQVWKVGDKMFAIGWVDAPEPAYTFKVTKIAFEMLRDRPGLRPAPYLASRGLLWIQQYAEDGIPDAELREYLRHSHAMAAAKLTKAKRRELGLG